MTLALNTAVPLAPAFAGEGACASPEADRAS